MYCNLYAKLCSEIKVCYLAETCQECRHCTGKIGTLIQGTNRVIYD